MAIEALAEGDVRARGRHIAKALAIVTELSAALDPSGDADLARALGTVYDFAAQELVRANLKDDPAPIQAALRVLEPVRGAWSEMLRSHPDTRALHDAAESARQLSGSYL